MTGVIDMVSHPSSIPTTHILFSPSVFYSRSCVHCLHILFHSSFCTCPPVCLLMSVSLTRSLSLSKSFCLSKHLLPDSLTFPNLSNMVWSPPSFLFISSTVSLCLFLIHLCLSLSFTLAFGTRELCGSEVTGEQPPKSDSWPVTMTTARCCVKGQDNK